MFVFNLFAAYYNLEKKQCLKGKHVGSFSLKLAFHQRQNYTTKQLNISVWIMFNLTNKQKCLLKQ